MTINFSLIKLNDAIIMGSDTFTYFMSKKTGFIQKYVLFTDINTCINFSGVAGIQGFDIFTYLDENFRSSISEILNPLDIAKELKQRFTPLWRTLIQSIPSSILRNPRYNFNCKFDIGGFFDGKPKLASLNIENQTIEQVQYTISCPEIVKQLFRTYGDRILQPSLNTVEGYIDHVRTTISNGIEYDKRIMGNNVTSGGKINIIIIRLNSIEETQNI